MAKHITVNTRLGTGGKWITVARFNAGPRNLLKAVRLLNAERKQNSGLGGYLSNLEIDGQVIGSENLGWDLTQSAASRIIADPAIFAPYVPLNHLNCGLCNADEDYAG